MMRARHGHLSSLLCVALLSSTGCVIFASTSEYADYREVRLASDPATRALAMRTYLDRNPDGHWSEDIKEAHKREELATFESGKDSHAGLTHYLSAYPDGAYVSQARSRLHAVTLIEQQRKQAGEQAEQLAEARKRRAEELRRTWVGRFLGYWVKTLTELHGWGEAIPDVAQKNPLFSKAFGALPRPRCTQDECVKYYMSEYAVPVPGGNRLERTLSLLLRLRMRAGKLERAELLLPERGFTYWYELENRRAVNSADPEARSTAVTWALEHAQASIAALGETLTTTPTTPTTSTTSTTSTAPAPALPVIDAPAVGPTGERVDTAIEAPSDPQNRIVEDNAGIGVEAVKPRRAEGADSTRELIKPPAPKAAPDMTFDAVGVSRQGQRVEAAPPAAPAPAANSGAATELLFTAPLEVPKTGGAAATNAPPPTAATSAESATTSAAKPAVVPALVRAFQAAGLRLTLFAAGSEGPGYDGLVIERVASKPKRVAPPAAVTAPAAPAASGSAAPTPAVAKPVVPPTPAPAAPVSAPTP